jgi:hypothetical protein
LIFAINVFSIYLHLNHPKKKRERGAFARKKNLKGCASASNLIEIRDNITVHIFLFKQTKIKKIYEEMKYCLEESYSDSRDLVINPNLTHFACRDSFFVYKLPDDCKTVIINALLIKPTRTRHNSDILIQNTSLIMDLEAKCDVNN